MSYLDQITIGSTTYDLQDSNAQRKTIEGSGAPTTSTAAEVGTHYLNTSASSAPYEYLCIDDTGGSYTWVEVGGDPSKELPSGGTTGQVLTKSSGTNYDAAWADVDALPPVTSSDNGKYLGVNSGDWAVVNGVSDIYYGTSTPPAGKKVWIDPSGTEDVHSIPSGGTQGQVLTKNSATNYDAAWANVSHEIPSGGTQGQVLTKSSATDYDTAWANASSDKVMVVTITYASNTYSSDKTVDEILAEINGGGNVVLRYDGYEYQLKEIFGNEVRFTYVGVTTNSAREYRFRIYKSSNSTLVSYDTTSFYKTDVPEVLSSSFNITIVDNGGSHYYVLSSDLQDVLELYELQMSEPFSNVTGSLSISDTTNSNAHPNYDVYPLTGISWAYEYDEYEGGDNWKGTLQFSKAVIKNGHSYLRTITVAQFQNRYDGWYDAVITETETLIT